MTHREFSSKGGKASKGTDKAKERAKKGAAVRWKGHIPLDERSAWIKEKAQQKADDEIPGIQPDEYSQEMPNYDTP